MKIKHVLIIGLLYSFSSMAMEHELTELQLAPTTDSQDASILENQKEVLESHESETNKDSVLRQLQERYGIEDTPPGIRCMDWLYMKVIDAADKTAQKDLDTYFDVKQQLINEKDKNWELMRVCFVKMPKTVLFLVNECGYDINRKKRTGLIRSSILEYYPSGVKNGVYSNEYTFEQVKVLSLTEFDILKNANTTVQVGLEKRLWNMCNRETVHFNSAQEIMDFFSYLKKYRFYIPSIWCVEKIYDQWTTTKDADVVTLAKVLVFLKKCSLTAHGSATQYICLAGKHGKHSVDDLLKLEQELHEADFPKADNPLKVVYHYLLGKQNAATRRRLALWYINNGVPVNRTYNSTRKKFCEVAHEQKDDVWEVAHEQKDDVVVKTMVSTNHSVKYFVSQAMYDLLIKLNQHEATLKENADAPYSVKKLLQQEIATLTSEKKRFHAYLSSDSSPSTSSN